MSERYGHDKYGLYGKFEHLDPHACYQVKDPDGSEIVPSALGSWIMEQEFPVNSEAFHTKYGGRDSDDIAVKLEWTEEELQR